MSISSYESASSGLDQEPGLSCMRQDHNADTSPETTNSGADSSYHTFPYGMRKYTSALDLNTDAIEIALARIMRGVSFSVKSHPLGHPTCSDPDLVYHSSRRPSIHKMLIRVKDASTQTDEPSKSDIGINTILNGQTLINIEFLSPHQRQILRQQVLHQLLLEPKLIDELLAIKKQLNETQQTPHLNRSCSHNDLSQLDNHMVSFINKEHVFYEPL